MTEWEEKLESLKHQVEDEDIAEYVLVDVYNSLGELALYADFWCTWVLSRYA